MADSNNQTFGTTGSDFGGALDAALKRSDTPNAQNSTVPQTPLGPTQDGGLENRSGTIQDMVPKTGNTTFGTTSNDFGGAYTESILRGNVQGTNAGYNSTGEETSSPGLSPTQDGGVENRYSGL